MIISHKHKFIFIKTAKTAGTSIEIFLSQFCGEDDIITPIRAEDEAIRNQLGFRGAQNYQTPQGKGYNHMPLSEVYQLYGTADDFRDYFKFTVERHPGERMLSLYHYWKHKKPDIPDKVDDEFIKNHIQILKNSGWNLYTIDGKIAVDLIMDYEKLSEDLAIALDKLGISVNEQGIRLPNAKSGYRADRRSYKEVLSEDAVELLKHSFREEIDVMHYNI